MARSVRDQPPFSAKILAGVFDIDRQFRAVLYCRSTRASARGLQAQEERCRSRAEAEGATEITTIMDRDPGPADLGRPAIVQLRQMLEERAVDLVVVESTERLTRKISDLRALMQDVSRAGARLLIVAP